MPTCAQPGQGNWCGETLNASHCSCEPAGASFSGTGAFTGYYGGSSCNSSSGEFCFSGITITGKVYASITIDGVERELSESISAGPFLGGCE